MKRIIPIVLAAISVVILLGSHLTYAATGSSVNDSVDCSQAPDSSFCQQTNHVSSDPLLGQKGILTKGGGLLALITGIISVFMMIYAGLKFVLSAGDTGKITTARNTIIYASIGLIIAISAQTIVIFILKKL